MEPVREVNRKELLRQAGTRLSFRGGEVIGRRLIPESGYTVESGDDQNIAMLKDNGGGTTATVTCDCGLEGGNCVPVTMEPEDGFGKTLTCLPDEGCGSSGLFCFMEVSFTGGQRLEFKM